MRNITTTSYTNAIATSKSSNTQDGFTRTIEAEFNRFINQPDHGNGFQIGHVKREEYRKWLWNPTDLPTGNAEEKQKQHIDKYRARSLFELHGSQIWRKAHGNEPAKYVACSYGVFECIKSTHINLGHAGVTKTFQSLQERYYGINKKEVMWFMKPCQICLVCTCSIHIERVAVDVLGEQREQFITDSDAYYIFCCVGKSADRPHGLQA